MTKEEAKFYLDKLLPQWIGLLPTKEGNILLEASRVAVGVLEQTSWIPISERLPEESGDYLVTTKWKGRYSGNVYVETNMAEYRRKTKEWDCVDVIAWMPFLPQAYTESESDD